MPIGNCFSRFQAFAEMMCSNLGLSLNQTGKLRFERRGNATMRILAHATQQCAVGYVLDQSMLEQIIRIGRCPPLKYQARLDEAVQRLIQCALAKLADRRSQKLVGEFTADRRAGLCDLFGCRAQSIEAGQQRCVQCCRNSQRGSWYRGDHTAIGISLEHRLRHLLDKQRHAVAVLDDLGDDIGWQGRLVACHALNQCRDVCAAEAAESQCRHFWLPDPWREELWSQGQDQQHLVSSRLLDELIDEFARRRVDPMQILENYQHRMPARYPVKLAQQRCEDALFLSLWGEIGRSMPVASLNGQQLRN